ncbi:hypothetical protein BT63DRAFT_451595 [Microthyrium microscopicum]|uniref:Uncharacterized protein n=1 Tax=Microthyrium microscopicum TaxID=703497 RepID=A0A6A6UP97_9PEZI|nr:hypothetical protein BT63DRAFT_451595 [Microthyrium microscopicum]
MRFQHTLLALASAQSALAGLLRYPDSLSGHTSNTIDRRAASNITTNYAVEAKKAIAGLTAQGADFLKSKNIKQGDNPRSNGPQGIWLGNDGQYKLKVTNYKNEPMVLVMWHGNAWLNDNKPIITQSLGPIEEAIISVNGNAPGIAFSAVYAGTKANGLIENTWGELTTSQWSTINVSRLPNMNGDGLTLVSPTGCRAHMSSCVFMCRNGATKCGDPKSYDLYNCKFPGAGTGEDPFTHDPSGGCNLGSGGDISAIFSVKPN